ncbi:MAG TPA: MFS transporter [Anaerolineales bacterium]|nr:MFS transporter [Anaerolineales bacterium]
MDPAIQAEIDGNYKHNFTVNVIDGTFFWFGASFFATRTIAPLFLSYLTDNTLAFGILAMVVSTGWLIPQLFTANWVQNLPIKKIAPVNIGFFTERLPIMLLPLAAWLALRSESLAVIVFIMLISWHVIGAGVVAVGWQDMLAKIFSVERRGRFFGTANFGGTATGVLGASVVAWLLEKYAFPNNFMIAFGAAGLFIFISWILLAMTKEPAVPPTTQRLDQKSYWKSLPSIFKSNQNFRRYLFSRAVLAFGGMAVGFYTIYTVQTWDVSDSMVGLFTTSLLVGQAVSNLVFGWMADKYGHKMVLEISALMLILTAGVALFAPSPGYFYLVFAMQGVSEAGLILSGIMIVFEFCEPEVRPTYIGLTNTLIGIFLALAPMLGLVLIDSLGYAWMFGGTLLASLGGWLLLRFTVKEPRRENQTA